MADDKAMEYLRNYHGSIDSTALLLAYRAGRRGGLEDAAPIIERLSDVVQSEFGFDDCVPPCVKAYQDEVNEARKFLNRIRALRDSLQPEGEETR